MYSLPHPERQNQVENQNTLLVERMMHSSSLVRSQKGALMKDSLNSGYRSRKDREIDNGNQVPSLLA